MRSREMARAARPVAGVLLVVLAVVSGFGAVVSGPQAWAAPGEEVASSALSSQTSTGETPDDEESDEVGVSETPEEADEETDEPDPTDESSQSADSSESPTDDASGEPTDEPSDEPSEEPSGEPTDDTVIEVDNAVFRWGISNQSNARSHNPGAFNFFSAGVADPGRGGVHLLEKHWQAKDGKVTIQKWMGKKRGWRRAAWESWKTNASGKPTGVDRNFSLHNIVIRGGKGTVDVESGDAEIRWKGTFTVVYYSGNTIFTVTDPVLTLTGGAGELRATLGGFASDRDTMSSWEPVPSVKADIATLAKVKLGERGFSATPAYERVVAKGFSDQVTNGPWGAFPQQMLDFLKPLEIAQFWYSTGLATDDTKLPLPLTVSYDDSAEIAPTPDPEPTSPPAVDNPVNDAPPPPPVAAPQVGPAPAPAAAPPGLPAAVPESQRELLTPADLEAVTLAAAPSHHQAVPDRTWWLVGSLLLVAAFLLFIPARPRA